MRRRARAIYGFQSNINSNVKKTVNDSRNGRFPDIESKGLFAPHLMYSIVGQSNLLLLNKIFKIIEKL